MYDVYDRSIETIASYTDKDFIPIVALDASESRPDISTLDPAAIYVDYTNLYSGMYFKGKHVDQVLDGAELAWPVDVWGQFERPTEKVPGLPINGYEGIDYSDEPFYEGSHIELQNGVMSHQMYRNWNVLMEAELALLQDIGFNFDRKRFYGYSPLKITTAIGPEMRPETIGLRGKRVPNPGGSVYIFTVQTISSHKKLI